MNSLSIDFRPWRDEEPPSLASEGEPRLASRGRERDAGVKGSREAMVFSIPIWTLSAENALPDPDQGSFSGKWPSRPESGLFPGSAGCWG